ncbi:MAG: hypothetical protein JW797_01555 [Bradymonadales bacterium]|nr:hypothetical protein [Bradymonadales bacterium]
MTTCRRLCLVPFPLLAFLLGNAVLAQPLAEPSTAPAQEEPAIQPSTMPALEEPTVEPSVAPVEQLPPVEQTTTTQPSTTLDPMAGCLAELDTVQAAIQEEDSGRALVLLDMAQGACMEARRVLIEAATAPTAPDPLAPVSLWRMEMQRTRLLVQLNRCDDSRRILREVSAQVDLPAELRDEFAQVAHLALACGPRPGEPSGGTLSVTPGFTDIVVAGTTITEQDAYLIGDYCAGAIPTSPNYILEVTEGMQLGITAYSYSGNDLVLVVTDGTITFCNDDWDGLNPGLSEFFPAGTYSIYVGQYSFSGQATDFNLTVSSNALIPSYLSPVYGTVYVGPGYPRSTMSGNIWGVNDASTVFDPSMAGWIASDPDFQLYVEGTGEVWITVSALPTSDLTLIVDGPGGRYYNDDADGHNPGLNAVMTPGTYNVWVGDKAGPGTGVAYGIQFSSYNPMTTLGTEPTFGVATPSVGSAPVQLSGTSQGVLPVSDFFGQSCYGSIPVSPSHKLVVSESGMFEIVARSADSSDLIIAVSGPAGYYCNDDYEGLNPGIRRWLSPGEYLVFVGQLSPSAIATTFTTTFTATGGTPPPDLTAFSTGAFGSVAINTTAQSTTLSGISGGPNNAADLDASCRGYISQQPSYILDVVDYINVSIMVLSEGDTTLVVMGSDGTVYCNDDLVGFNPSLSEYLAPGRYGVWIGSFRTDTSYPFMINFNPMGWY